MADTENTLILETTQGPVTIEIRRLGPEAQGRIQQGTTCARHGLDGPRGKPRFRR